MFKWIKRLAIGAAAILLLALLTGLTYEQWSRQSVAKAFPPPGTLVEVNGKFSHLQCSGEGSPTIILEAGLDNAGSQVWETIRPALDQLSRVCAYDRAGIMWSDRRERPRDAEKIVEELHDLLAVAAEPPPYVMVGHSLGGPLIRVFAHRFRDEVVGLIFVDSSHPEQNERLPPEFLAAREVPLSLLRGITAFGIMRLNSPAPSSALPEEVGQATIGYLPQSMEGVTDEMEAMDSIFEQAQHTGPFGDLPTVVLTAGKLPDQLPPWIDEDNAVKMQRVWAELQDELVELSTNTDHRVIADASHYIHWDDPEAAIAAVRDVVTAHRDGAPVRRAEI